VKLMEIMTRTVETCSSRDSIQSAAQKMKENDCGALPVVDGGRLSGIVTDRDLVLRGLAEGKSPDAKVSACMTTKVITAQPETDAHEAANTMAENQIRRLVIMDGDRVAGIVALGDMALQQIHVDEAGSALSGISAHSHPMGH
jgi:CBS domain-containing protein